MIKIINNIKKITIILLSLIFCFSSMSYSIDNINTIVDGTAGTYFSGSSSTSTANPGKVKELTLSSTISSSKWQAFYGNLSSTILLGEDSNTFINFGDSDASYFDSVFATSSTSFDFTNKTAANVSKIDALLGFSNSADSDQLEDVFNESTTIEGVSNVSSVTLNTNFKQGILYDGVNDTLLNSYAFTSVINSKAVGFKNQKHDFEMIVPVNGSSQSYNFYLSIK